MIALRQPARDPYEQALFGGSQQAPVLADVGRRRAAAAAMTAIDMNSSYPGMREDGGKGLRRNCGLRIVDVQIAV